MKNLDLKGSQFVELNEKESKEIDGGLLGFLAIGAAIKLAVVGTVVAGGCAIIGAIMSCCGKNNNPGGPTIP